MLIVLDGGKTDAAQDDREKEKARVRAMFESNNNFGSWSKNSTEAVNCTAERYTGKLREAMLKCGSFRGKKKDV
jgi:hypothetical protein